MLSQNDYRKLSDADWNLLQERADQFAERLKKGPVQDWAPFLEDLSPSMRTSVLHEMVKVDLDHRWQRGEKPLLEEYISRHGDIGDIDTIPVDLICEEYRIRRKRGGEPSLDDYYGRFPEQFAAVKKELEPESHVQNTVTFEPSSNVNTVVLPVDASKQSPRTQASGPPTQGVNNYEKTEMLGHGNFGEVWKAKAPGGIEVAIKVVTQPIERDAAQRELHALELVKNLRHPCLLATLAIWIDNDRLHIVMELADGSLRDRFKQARKQNQPGIPLSELLMYFADAAEGLDFLHTRKVFHRDVKPDNILLLHGHAKVADFGLARLQEKQMATVSFAGTPIYMAPETWGGKGGPRSDQYSLAFAYAELRQGKRPIEGGDFTEVMARTLEGDVDLSGVPAEEAKILRRALSKNPDERFANCSEFVAALARATNNPVRLRTSAEADLRKEAGSGPDSATYKESYQEPAGERRSKGTGKLILIGAAVGLLVGGAFTVWKFGGNDSHPSPTTDMAGKERRENQDDSSGKGVGNEIPPKKDGDGRPKESLFVPDRFTAAAGAATAQVGARRVPDRIEFPLKNGDKAVFILMTPSAGKPFYAMENKVWNAFFAEFAQANPDAVAKTVWRNDMPPRQPATRINAAEAFAFARWLGGKLPTTAQWDYAAGVQNKAGRDGPSMKEQSAAVGRSEPRSVDDPVHDDSALGIRDLGGNGREWTRNILKPDGSMREGPIDIPGPTDLMVLRGRNYTLARPLTYSDLEYQAKVPQTQFYTKANPYTTFRVVIELPE
jgi:serine/threonine protein kinase